MAARYCVSLQPRQTYDRTKSDRRVRVILQCLSDNVLFSSFGLFRDVGPIRRLSNRPIRTYAGPHLKQPVVDPILVHLRFTWPILFFVPLLPLPRIGVVVMQSCSMTPCGLCGVTAASWLAKCRGFESRPVRFQVTALGKLLTRMCFCHEAV